MFQLICRHIKNKNKECYSGEIVQSRYLFKNLKHV